MAKPKLPSLPNKPSDDMNAVCILMLDRMRQYAPKLGTPATRAGRKGYDARINLRGVLLYLYRDAALSKAELQTALGKVATWLTENSHAYTVESGIPATGAPWMWWVSAVAGAKWPAKPATDDTEPPAGVVSTKRLRGTSVPAAAAVEEAAEDTEPPAPEPPAEPVPEPATEPPGELHQAAEPAPAPDGPAAELVPAEPALIGALVEGADSAATIQHLRAVCTAYAQRTAALEQTIKFQDAQLSHLEALCQLAVSRIKV